MFNLTMDLPKDTPVVGVKTTNNRGFTPEEVAEDCVKKIISISNNVDPVLRDQAVAYSKDMEKVIAFYMREAITSDRTTVYNAIKDAGHPDLAELIRRL
jgi:RNA 3'-terminal phosphate cyclase